MSCSRIAVALCAGLVVLAACAPFGPPAPTATLRPTRSGASATATRRPTATASVQTPIMGGTLTVGIGSLDGFDPCFVDDEGALYVISNVFSMLFREAGGELIPDLATDWAYENDTTVVFHLRKGARFHDGNAVFASGEGREVVADDVVYSLERYMTYLGTSAPADLKAAFESVEAVDRYTVRVHLGRPDPLLFSRGYGLSGLAVIPREGIDRLGKDFAVRPVGSGPFMLESYTDGVTLVLVRNDRHWLEANLDSVIVRAIPEESAQVEALEGGKIDILVGNVSREDYARWALDRRLTLYASGCPAQVQLLFSAEDPLFEEQRLRQALALAVDRDGIGREIWGGQYVGGCGTAGPGAPGYDAGLCERYFRYDPDEARRLLGELGWTTDNDGRVKKDGKQLSFELEVWSTGVGPVIGAAVKAELEQIGVRVDLEIVEFDEFVRDLATGTECMMLMQGWCGDGGTSGLWGREGAARSLGFEDPQVDELLDRADATIDADVRDSLLRQAAGRVYGQYWAIPLGAYDVHSVSRSYVRDYAGAAWTMNLCTEANNVWLDR